MGGVLDGLPSRVKIDPESVQAFVDRRRPGVDPHTSPRREKDRVELLSGISRDGLTLGSPIGFIIRNTDTRSSDYQEVFRPNHADYTYQAKYGIRDHRGGGRASARETAVRVVGGALAMQVIAQKGIRVEARAVSIGRTTDPAEFEAEILCAKKNLDSVGGIIECVISGLPAGLGEPVFGKFQAMLASAMMSINAAKGFEYGDGFDAARQYGSEQTDNFYYTSDGRVGTRTNHSGGIQGGITNGSDVIFRVAFKPVATLPRPLDSIDDSGNNITLEVHGRHDPCVIPRAIPVVEAMTAMTVLDALLLSGAQ